MEDLKKNEGIYFDRQKSQEHLQNIYLAKFEVECDGKIWYVLATMPYIGDGKAVIKNIKFLVPVIGQDKG